MPPRQIILLMICLIIDHFLFYPRSPPPIHNCPPHFCNHFWIREQNGSRCTGPIGSKLFLKRTSFVNPENILCAALRRFHQFCYKFNVTASFPLSECTLCSFSAYLADQALAPQTINHILCSMQISLGLPDPRDITSMPILKRVQVGISRARFMANSQPQVRLLITVHILANIHQYLKQLAPT